MSDGAKLRQARRSRPTMEPLEGRALLSDLTGAQNSTGSAKPGQVRRLAYTTPEGTRVAVTLYGNGSLAGSTVDPNGVLNLQYSGTNQQTGIVASVHGGTGRAKLGSIKHRDVPIDTLSGVGESLVNVVNLRNFDLVDGGRINLAGGVHVLMLNTIGANTQVNLRNIPSSVQSGSTSATENSTPLNYSTTDGETSLSIVGVQFAALPNLIPAGFSQGGKPGPPPAPPGVVVSVNSVNGPNRSQLGLGMPAIYAYDATKNAVVRFDLSYDSGKGGYTGTPAVTSPTVATGSAAQPSVSVSSYRNRPVVLVNNGDVVSAYDPLTLQPLGKSFSLAPLKSGPNAIAHPDRLGTAEGFTLVGDSQDASPTTLGQIQAIDVTKSLDTGVVAKLGNQYSSARQFGLSGGFTGVPGFNGLLATGGAHFDTYQPALFQLGAANLKLSTTSGGLSESSRTQVSLPNGQSNISNAHGATPATPPNNLNNALGSLNTNLALVTGQDAAAGTTTVTLYNPSTFASAGTVTLQTADSLTSLSQSTYPALAGAALIDVQGNMQSFRAKQATGLVLHDQGGLNLTKIHSATDTTVVAYPVGHVRIPNRNNVVLESTKRNVGDRNGVIVNTDLKATGPLSLP